MSKRIKKILQTIIVEHAVLDAGENYRCLNGVSVPFGSPECVGDLEYRVDDAVQMRNDCPHLTADRSHLNGVLNFLRRNLRKARKIQAFNELEEDGI